MMPNTPDPCQSHGLERNCSTISRFVAPIAFRTPISLVRSVHRNQHYVHDADSADEQPDAGDGYRDNSYTHQDGIELLDDTVCRRQIEISLFTRLDSPPVAQQTLDFIKSHVSLPGLRLDEQDMPVFPRHHLRKVACGMITKLSESPDINPPDLLFSVTPITVKG